jgi:adenylate cyclase
MIDRSLTLNPSFARGWAWSAALRNIVGQPSIAIEHYKTSLRLSPRDRLGTFGITFGIAHFLNNQFEDAAAILLAALEQAPSFPHTLRVLAASYAHMGRLDEAREIVERLRAITPVLIPSRLAWRNPEHRELFLSGLRLAAGEAT